MAEDPEPVPEPSAEPVPPEKDSEDEAGDFITRNVLEKDTVFFEG
jgi:hypothetical protein